MAFNSELNIPAAYEADKANTETHGKFVISPFESGYGHTIGNALRRVLLSSLDGAAISSVKIEGIDHELCAVPGVAEDVTEIVLNLKKIKLNLLSGSENGLVLNIDRKASSNNEVVCAGDIQTAGRVEILNPEQVICTLLKAGDSSFYADLEVSKGRGWNPAERYQREGALEKIYIDSLFSPVSFVRYTVTKARKGDNTEMDCLTLEIDTDGRINPQDALEKAAMILQNHLRPFLGAKAGCDDPVNGLSADDKKLFAIMSRPVESLELTVRSLNCLKQKNIRTIGELCMKSDNFMMQCHNFGRKSLDEVKEKLDACGGLKLNMEMSESLKHAIEAMTEKSQPSSITEEA